MMALDNRLPSFGWKMKSVQNASGAVGEIWIYDDIVAYESWWSDGGVTPKKFKEDLDALGDVSRINVYINSNGGDVFAGQAIHSQLSRHKAEVWVYVDGVAASIASVIAMAGDKIICPSNAQMMIHLPWTIAMGNAKDMRKMADDLEVITESLVAAYMKRFKGTKEELMALLEGETWLPADRCVELGLADEIEEGKKVAASLMGNLLMVNGKTMDLSRFHNRPQIETVAELPTPTPIVKDELPTVSVKCEGDTYIVVADGKDVGKFTVTDELRAILAKGRVLSAENEDHIRSAHDALGKVLDKLAEDPEPDNDPDDRLQMAVAELKPDERIDTLLAKVDALTAKVEALTPAPQSVVEPPVDKPSPKNNGEDVVIDEPKHVIVLDKPANEVDIEAETLKQAVKAALEETKAEMEAKKADWVLANLGKVD